MQQLSELYPSHDPHVQYHEPAVTQQWYSGLCGIDTMFNNRQPDDCNIPSTRYRSYSHLSNLSV